MRVDDKPGRRISRESEARQPAGRGCVLIVDDEPNVRMTFRMALESAGLDVEEAEDGAAALERLPRSACDVVLLDLMMPGMGGMEVLRRLRDRGDEVPVVIVTAHGSIPDAVEAMRLGAIDFLSKPLTPEILRGVVAEVLLRHGPAPPEPTAPPPPSPSSSVEVTLARPSLNLADIKLALNRRRLDEAAEMLERALDADPESSEALTLMGLLQECRGQDHAAYQSYRRALESNLHFGPARDNMRRYCARFGLDHDNPQVNPAAGT